MIVIKGKGVLIEAGSERACISAANHWIGALSVDIKKLTKQESQDYWKTYILGKYYPTGYPSPPEYGAFITQKEDIRKWERLSQY